MDNSSIRLTEVASFPAGHFLENIAVRRDGSLLVTDLSHQKLWYISSFGGNTTEPIPLFTFDQKAMGIIEADHDIFYVSTGVPSHGRLYRFDLRGWAPGAALVPEVIIDDTQSLGMLNGSCYLGQGVILLADCFAGSIFRVDLSADGKKGTLREWLKHDSMKHNPHGAMPDQPGVNGVRYADKINYLYYTSTAQQLFMRVAVDSSTMCPVGEPELVAEGMMADDFCIDEKNSLAYLTTHRQNTIDLVSLDPAANKGPRRSILGNPVVDLMIGPSAIAWGRAPEDYGRCAYITTDGGIKAPMPGGPRPSKILRLEL